MTTGLEDVLQQQEDGQDEATPGTAEGEETQEQAEDKTGETGTEETPPVEGEGEGDETTPADKTPPADEPAVAPDPNELNELRQFIREQRKEIAAMKAKLSRMNDSGEVDDDGNPVVKYTPLEQMQMELHNVARERMPLLEVMAEAMEANPKYSDIYEVCTKSNFDDIFEMAATAISRQEGRDFSEVLVQLELEVWKKPNPYKYMYSIIKDNHPKYKGKETPAPKTDTPPKVDVKEALKQQQSKTAAKVLEAQKAPGSVAAAGAGENLGSGGWTAAKIDDLDESELHTVPKDIYQKYMMGKLK